jgi:hypothetical protein
MPIIWSQNIAEAYAKLFLLPPRSPEECAWQFRERVARTLEQMGEHVRAHEALWNERMSNDPYATGPLARGNDDMFIATIAQYVEAAYQATQQQAWREGAAMGEPCSLLSTASLPAPSC